MALKITPYEYNFLKDDEIAVEVIQLAARDDDPTALDDILEMLEEAKGSEKTEQLRKEALGDYVAEAYAL
jgi:hypothetical protein